MSDVPALMELSEFVETTIVQILCGVRNASSQVFDEKAGSVREGLSDTKQNAIRFDIAVTVTGKNAGEGGAKVKVLGLIDVGGSGMLAHEESTVSRVQFTVPVRFPSS